MLVLAYIAALGLNGVAAYLSGSTGMRRLALLLAASFALCEAVGFASVSPPMRQFFADYPRSRTGVFFLIDIVFFLLCLTTIYETGVLPRLREVFKLTYIGMFCAHVAVLVFGSPTLWGYDSILNVLCAGQITMCFFAAISIIARKS